MSVTPEGARERCVPWADMGQLIHEHLPCCCILVACDCVKTPGDAAGTKHSSGHEVLEAHICSCWVLAAFSHGHPL